MAEDPGAISDSNSDDSETEKVKVVVEVEEEPALPVPEYTDEELTNLINYVKGHVSIFGLDDANDWNENAEKNIKDWLMHVDDPMLFIYFDKVTLFATCNFPLVPVIDLTYFMREKINQIFSVENFHDEVIFATIHEDIEGSLLNDMECLYAPMLFNTLDWSENVKENIISGFQSFVTHLIELHYKLSGLFLLYIPKMEHMLTLLETTDESLMNKKLDSIVVNWTAKIRSCINDYDRSIKLESLCPIDEFDFWVYRFEVLSALKTQFDDKNLLYILELLEKVQSKNVEQFNNLVIEVDNEIEKAKSNVKYLSVLVPPTHAIIDADVSGIPALLPEYLQKLRLIWTYSDHLNSTEDINKLFIYLSNQIVKCCQKHISMKKLLNGYPRYGINVCNAAIQCCLCYKLIFDKMMKYFDDNGHGKPWELDKEPIFRTIDEFIFRTDDLIDICECQIVFGRIDETIFIPKPQFGCHNALEFERNCEEVELKFLELLETFRYSPSVMMNIFDENWDRDIAHFKKVIRNLERSTKTIIANVFMHADNIEENMDVLTALYNFSGRKNIRAVYLGKLTEMWQIFLSDILQTYKEILSDPTNQRLSFLPKCFGKVVTLQLKYKRFVRLRELINKAEYLPECFNLKTIIDSYEKMTTCIEKKLKDYSDRCIYQLTQDSIKKFDRYLIARSVQRASLLECNIDRVYLNMIIESSFFDLLKVHSPPTINLQRLENSKMVYNSVVSIVLLFNNLITSLSDTERVMFKIYLTNCEKKILPAMFALTWDGELTDTFISECLKQLEESQYFVSAYKRINICLCRHLEKMCDTPIFEIDTSTTYTLNQFKLKFVSLREEKLKKLNGIYKKMIELIFTVYEGFGGQLKQMATNWYEYLIKYEKLMQQCLVTCAINTLKNVYNSFHAEGFPRPFLQIDAELQDVNFVLNPSKQSVQSCLKYIFADIIMSFKILPKITEKFVIEGDMLHEMREFETEIFSNKDYISLHSKMEAVLVRFNTLITKFINKWSEYSPYWTLNKDLYLSKYEESDLSPDSFAKNIEKFEDLAYKIGLEPETSQIYFIKMEAANLKNGLLQHIADWQQKHIDLLKKLSHVQIANLYDYWYSNIEFITTEPTTCVELHAIMVRYAFLIDDLPNKEIDVYRIRDYFELLQRYEVPISPRMEQLRDELLMKWKWYENRLREAAEDIENYKDLFKNSLLDAMIALEDDAKQMLNNFNKIAPISIKTTMAEAMATIAKLEDQLAELLRREAEIHANQRLLGIEPIPNPVIQAIRRILDLLKNVWKHVGEWRDMWDLCEGENIWNVDISLKAQLVVLIQHFEELYEILIEENWEVLVLSLKYAKQFDTLLIEIEYMRNSAMRDRHWNKFRRNISPDFNEETSTMGELIKMKTYRFKKMLHMTSYAATKELEIEHILDGIEAKWVSTLIDVIPYIDNSCLFQNTNIILDGLEDHMMVVAEMIPDKYARPFEVRVDSWEKKLSYMSETLEFVMLNQNKWLSLNELFKGEDLREDYAKIAFDFKEASNEWVTNALQIFGKRTVTAGLFYKPMLLETFVTLLQKFEKIEMDLKEYLNKRREVFPRFFLISDLELIEILQAVKNPIEIQKHFTNLYQQLDRINLNKNVITPKIIKWEVNGIYSADGEYMKFHKMFLLDQEPENWFTTIEKNIRLTIKELLIQSRTSLKKNYKRREKWLDSFPGQITILAALMQWTIDVTRSLIHCRIIDKKIPLKIFRRRHKKVCARLCDIYKSPVAKELQRKLFNMLSIELHNRDIVEHLYKIRCKDVNSFDWVSQLRYYWDREVEDLNIRQTDAKLWYGYEYIGNSPRLIITPLTDRCYVTLTACINNKQGCYFHGPTGAGKTSTIMNLAKAVGIWAISFTCSESLKYSLLITSIVNIMHNGLWGCFDRFNEISSNVLSTISEDITTIYNGFRKQANFVKIQGKELKLNNRVALFMTVTTVNKVKPKELTESLKAIFRPVVMMKPDHAIITESLLFCDGFKNAKSITKNLLQFLKMLPHKLSANNFYELGMRTLITLLRYAAKKKKENPKISEEATIYIAMTDIILPKFTDFDRNLFYEFFNNTFPPSYKTNLSSEPKLRECITKTEEILNIQMSTTLMNKAVQLYEMMKAHHCILIYGVPGSGKSIVWKTLQEALKLYGEEESYKTYILNPRAIDYEQLFGYKDGESKWVDGVINRIVRDTEEKRKWIVLDGPMDGWIEGLYNSMDDTRKLTLTNTERIDVSDTLYFLFELTDLSTSAPSAISRCSLIFNDSEDLNWRQYVHCWLKSKKERIAAELNKNFEFYLPNLLAYKKANCRIVIPETEISSVNAFCRLLDCVLHKYNAVDVNNLENISEERLETLIKLWFLFCMTWSICITVDAVGRSKLDSYVREIEGIYPLKDTIYDYYVNVKRLWFSPWEKQIPSNWHFKSGQLAQDILIPTTDSLRYSFVISNLMKNKHPILLIGEAGSCKKAIARSVIHDLKKLNYMQFKMHFSSETKTRDVQLAIEGRTVKITKEGFRPPGKKIIYCCIDDFNLPKKDAYGTQAPLELLRQWIEHKYWFDRKTLARRSVQNMHVCGFIKSLPDFTNVSYRVMGKMNCINILNPTTEIIQSIFGTMLDLHLINFPKIIKKIGDKMTAACIDLYTQVINTFLPVPSKIHYTYNLKDMTKIYNGLLLSHNAYHITKPLILRLWIHECFRVFTDRFTDIKDNENFAQMYNSTLGNHYELTLHSLCPSSNFPIFGKLMSPEGYYSDLTDLVELKNFLLDKIADYNTIPGVSQMDLILYKEAICHICRILRAITLSNGHMLIIGIGGTGRSSLCKIATFVCGYNLYELNINKSEFNINDFRENLKKLYQNTSIDNMKTTFLLNDTQIFDESFMEIINSIYSTNEVPHLFSDEELDEIKRRIIERQFRLLEANLGGEEEGAVEEEESKSLGPEPKPVSEIKNEKPKELATQPKQIKKKSEEKLIDEETGEEEIGEELDENAFGSLKDLLGEDDSDAEPVIVSDIFEFISSTELLAADAEPISFANKLELITYILDKFEHNCHMVFCISPVKKSFRTYIRKYPGLMSTNIDWFKQWPAEALYEIAYKTLEVKIKLDIPLEEQAKEKKNRDSLIKTTEDRLRLSISEMFSLMHMSVCDKSEAMITNLKRYNNVASSLFMEFLRNYIQTMGEKRKSIKADTHKFQNGILKIDESQEKIDILSREMTNNQEHTMEVQIDCEKFIEVIRIRSRETDEAKTVVALKSEKIVVEEAECMELADVANVDLQKAMPAFNAAIAALNTLNKKDLSEVKSYAQPPTKVEMVLEAVMILLGKEPTWAEAKRQLGEQNFLEKLKEFDKNNISDKTLKKITGYAKNPELAPDKVGTVSFAAKSLIMWVRAIEKYGQIYKVVGPKIKKYEDAMTLLEMKQKELAEARAKLAELIATLAKLQAELDEKLALLERLKKELEMLRIKLERAYAFVAGLASEKIRWQEMVKSLEAEWSTLSGDCLLSVGFISYMGMLVSEYRDDLLAFWHSEFINNGVPVSAQYDFEKFYLEPPEVQDWNMKGLPSDKYSTENAIIITKTTRCPLIIDPQNQAQAWIINLYKKDKIKTVDITDAKYLKVIKNSMKKGTPLIIQNVIEKLDLTVLTILNKAIIISHGNAYIRFNNEIVPYNRNFRLFLTTRISNPHYIASVFMKANVINFAIKEECLEDQLLGIIVRKEKPLLEEKKEELITSIASDNKVLMDLKNDLLRQLNEVVGSLLDDDDLFNTLKKSDITSAQIKENLISSEHIKKNIEKEREVYRECALRASILYFVMNDLKALDIMYQFSLKFYITLFTLSIDKSTKSNNIDLRKASLNEYHTFSVYKFVNRSLFNKDKLIFSFFITIKVLDSLGKMDMAEYNFIVNSGPSGDKAEEMENPCTWITDELWDELLKLNKMPGFRGITDSFKEMCSEWRDWYFTTEPEVALLPGDWQKLFTQFKRLMFIKTVRPDRISVAITYFIEDTMGKKFADSPSIDMKSILDEFKGNVLILYVLSPNTDPGRDLNQFVISQKRENRYKKINMGPDQTETATKLIREAMRLGNWVYVANCHLNKQFLILLEKMIIPLDPNKIHPRFHLIISAFYYQQFPVSIIGNAVKISTEAPQGIKANMKYLYSNMTEEKFNICKNKDKYRRVIFAIAFLHSLLNGRKLFGPYGWNMEYNFLNNDFELCETFTAKYLDEYTETPWNVLKFLVSKVIYGGHFTNQYDINIMMLYLNEVLTDEVISTPFFRLSPYSQSYYIPRDGTLQTYRDYISLLPNSDPPELFGQDQNANSVYLESISKHIFSSLAALHSKVQVAPSKKKKVKTEVEIIQEIVLKIHTPIDYDNTVKLIGVQVTPLTTILLQEIQRYNQLLEQIRYDSDTLLNSIKGKIVISSDYELMMDMLLKGIVPPAWQNVFPSLKPLASWLVHLNKILSYFEKWADTTHPPKLHWLAAFSMPKSFLLAVLQMESKELNTNISNLHWEYFVTPEEDRVVAMEKNGVYIRHMYLEGARWDKKAKSLKEANLMEMTCPMPVIHFKPVLGTKSRIRQQLAMTYECPCYYYPNRADINSYILSISLDYEDEISWVKRATALLLSLKY